MALVCLQRDFEAGQLASYEVSHPALDPVRDDPRFQAILEGMVLADRGGGQR